MEINQKNLIKCFLSDLAAKEVKAGLKSFLLYHPSSALFYLKLNLSESINLTNI